MKGSNTSFCAGLGVRVVLVLGARQQIDDLLHKQGESPQYAAGYRVTDSVAMQTAVQAAGAGRMAVEAQLSKVLCVCVAHSVNSLLSLLYL